MEDAADVLAAAEAVRHGPAPADEAPPAYPTSFGADFVPPSHSTKLLQTKFATARDERIVFYELPHVYTVDGVAYEYSVTSLVKQHSEEFDASAIIDRMRRSRREAWPRLKYAYAPRKLAGPAEAVPTGFKVLVVVRATELTARCVAPAFAAQAADEVEALHGEVDLYATERAMTEAEILASWDANKTDAANRGTWIHHQLELWSNSLPCFVDVELLHGLRFVGEVLRPMGVRCWATEKEVFGEAEEVCGSVDWIGYYGDDDPDSIIIVDWKRSKKLDAELVSCYRRTDSMAPPFEHLQDVDGCKYALQLSCYAYLLEKYYGKKVRALALCCVHPEHAMYTFVPYLREEVAYLMRKRQELAAARVRVDFEDEDGTLPRCSITGRILYDGVVCDGRLCNRKDAAVRFPGAATTDATEETEMVRAKVRAVAYTVSAEEEALATCRSWSERMPATGLFAPP